MGRYFLVALAFCFTTSAAQAQMNSADIKWGPPPPGFTSGAQFAVLSGDPSKPGMFTIRIKMPAGYAVAPHWHPSDEIVTVIDGQMSLGMGDAIDKAKASSLKTGGYVMALAKMHHYAFTDSGATVQVTGTGPFAINYVNPKDDPRKK